MAKLRRERFPGISDDEYHITLVQGQTLNHIILDGKLSAREGRASGIFGKLYYDAKRRQLCEESEIEKALVVRDASTPNDQVLYAASCALRQAKRDPSLMEAWFQTSVLPSQKTVVAVFHISLRVPPLKSVANAHLVLDLLAFCKQHKTPNFTRANLRA
jgi:hypothetical protein